MSNYISPQSAYKLSSLLDAVVCGDPTEELLSILVYSTHGNIVSNLSEILRYVEDNSEHFPQFFSGGKHSELFNTAKRKCPF